jgi:tetratricopeptide (TPR) repeat protein
MFSADYYRNLKMILLHLVHPQGRGFIFASSRNQGLIPSINTALKEDMRAKNRPLYIVDLKEEELPLLTIQKAAAEHPHSALIVNFLDILIVTQGPDILQSLNYGREVLNQLNIPVLFWASESTRQLLANQAIDLYSQRRFADIVFEDAPLSTERPSLESHFDTQFKTTEEYQNIKLRITLLEAQLEEAKANHISDKSLCESLVPQLIRAYSEYNMFNEAKIIVDTYETCFEGTIVQSEALASYYHRIGNYTKSLEFLQNALSLELAQGFESSNEGQKELVGTYNWLATLHNSLNQPSEALAYINKAILISEQLKSPIHTTLITSYNILARTYQLTGQQNKALELNLKALNLAEKTPTQQKPELATSYNDTALAYFNLEQYEKANKLNLKALSIWEKILPYQHPILATSYFNIASTYYRLNNLPKAIDYMQKAVTIREKSLPQNHPDILISKKELYFFLEERQAQKNK